MLSVGRLRRLYIQLVSSPPRATAAGTCAKTEVLTSTAVENFTHHGSSGQFQIKFFSFLEFSNTSEGDAITPRLKAISSS